MKRKKEKMICLKNLEILVEEKKKEIDAAIEYELRKKFDKVCKISYFSTGEDNCHGKVYYVNIENYSLLLYVSKKYAYISKDSGPYIFIEASADSIVHEIYNWVYKRYNLMYATDYLYNQKNCILILLATKHKQFFGLPLDITKIIIKKILFFLFLRENIKQRIYKYKLTCAIQKKNELWEAEWTGAGESTWRK